VYRAVDETPLKPTTAGSGAYAADARTHPAGLGAHDLDRAHVILAGLVALIPVRRAVRTSPGDALRYI
jgi:hypothetical protein